MVWMIGNDYSWRARSEVLYEFFHHLLPIFATIMLFIVGWKYVVAVARYIRYGVANMDTLVGIGTIVAFLYSFIVAGFEESLSPYLDVRRSFYETVIIVIGFIEIGKYMETKVMSRTGEAIKALLGLQAKNALIIQNGEEVQISLEQVQLGDVMIVKPGEKVPLDGKIIS
jgi:Cu+-exporting ATPase